MTVTQIESIVSLEYAGKLTYRAIKLQEQAQHSLFFLISYFYYTKKTRAFVQDKRANPRLTLYSIVSKARLMVYTSDIDLY